jgi:hypothetical protein
MIYVHVGIAICFGTFAFGAHRALIATECEQIGGVLVHNITSAVMCRWNVCKLQTARRGGRVEIR